VLPDMLKIVGNVRFEFIKKGRFIY
jgi:hypothetical protein